MAHGGIELVVFDLGGVMVRIAGSWQAAARRAGLATASVSLGTSALERIDRVVREHETGRLAEAAALRALADASGGFDPEMVAAVLDAWLIEPYPDLEPLLERIAAAGLATACLSNTNPRHWRTMMHRDPRYQPLHRLTYRLSSFEIGAMKPHPDAYEAVETRAGVEPRQILFFDDSAENAAAANARGWRAFRIDPAGDTAAQMTRRLVQTGVIAEP